MLALSWANTTHLFCRNYEAASSGVDELVALADEKGAVLWRATGMIQRGWLSSLTGKAADAVEMITSGLTVRIAISAPESDFGTFVSGLKILFPGNRDRAKQRLVRMRRYFWERPRIWCCSDHSAGKSARRVTPMPRGSRPPIAALTRLVYEQAFGKQPVDAFVFASGGGLSRLRELALKGGKTALPPPLKDAREVSITAALDERNDLPNLADTRKLYAW
jgi:hypothetical protein